MLSKSSSVITLVVSTLGTGILYMPASFGLLGYAYGFASLASVAVLTYFTLYSLAYAAIVMDFKTDATYSSLAAAFSNKLKIVVDITMVGSNVGIMIATTRFFSHNAAIMLRGTGLDAEVLRKCSLCTIALLVAYFGTKGSLRSLAFISGIGIAGVLYYMALVVYYAYCYGHKLRDLDTTGSNYGSGFIKFVFALQCQFSFLSVFGQMEDKSLKGVSKVCAAVSLLVCLVYSASGFVGYLAVGREIGTRHILEVFMDREGRFMRHVIENSWDKRGILPGVLLGVFLFIWFGSLVFTGMPVISIVQAHLGAFDKRIKRAWVSGLLASLLFLVCLPARLDINTVLDVSAAVFAVPISFAYPSLFMILVSPRFSLKSLFSYLLIVLSLLFMLGVLHSVLTGRR